MYLRQLFLILLFFITTGCGPSDPLEDQPDLRVRFSLTPPEAVMVPANASSVRMAVIVFEAGPRAIQLEGLQLRHIGVGSPSDFQNIYLYDAYDRYDAFDGFRLTPGRSIDAATGNIQFYLPMEADRTIPAGGSRTFAIIADFGASSIGGQHGFELVSATAIYSSDTPTIEGDFPLTTNLFVVGEAGPRIDVRSGPTPADPVSGSANVEITSFTLESVGQSVSLDRITLSETGTIASEDLANLQLYAGADLITLTESVDPLYEHMTFGFVPSYRLDADTPVTFTVRATVSGPPDRTIRTCIEYPVDILARSVETGGEAAICISPLADGGCSAPGQGSFNGTVPGTYVSVTTR